jgi:hypothetical protein
VEKSVKAPDVSAYEKGAPIIFKRIIGKTTYEVSAYFSEKSKESISDKIFRMIKAEAAGL